MKVAVTRIHSCISILEVDTGSSSTSNPKRLEEKPRMQNVTSLIDVEPHLDLAGLRHPRCRF
jgi:hypothetical protein